jgi:hypothetical protein
MENAVKKRIGNGAAIWTVAETSPLCILTVGQLRHFRCFERCAVGPGSGQVNIETKTTYTSLFGSSFSDFSAAS